MTSAAAIAAKVPKPVEMAEAEQRIVALREEERALNRVLADAVEERDRRPANHRWPTRERQEELNRSCAEAHARIHEIRAEKLDLLRTIERCRPAYAEAVSRALRERRREAALRGIAALEQWRQAAADLEDVTAEIRLAGGSIKAVFAPMFTEAAINAARDIVADCARAETIGS